MSITPSSPIAISLNFDSLNEAYGFPPGYSDPSFFVGFDRVEVLAARYGFKLSVYVIGKDLENPSHARQVRRWHEAGHEVGNHTWSHNYSLGSQSRQRIQQEIGDAHARIADCVGEEPKGFIAPAWSTSRQVVKALTGLGYEYDTSVFPSVFMYPLMAKSLLSHARNLKKGLTILGRKDWHLPIVSPIEPYAVDAAFKRDRGGSLLIMPLPVLSRWQVCRWHTAGFFFGWDRHYAAIDKLANEREGFYYLIHPADFLGPEDLSTQHSQYLERMDVPLQEKLRRLEEVFQILKRSGRTSGTMLEKARYIRQMPTAA